MPHDLRLVLWLRVRHARTFLKRLMYFVSSDVETERSFMDRAYQFYAVGFVAVVLVLMWSLLLDTAQDVFTMLGAAGSTAVFSLALVLPLLLLAGLTLAALRYSPLKFSSPDLTYLAVSPVRTGVLVGVAALLKALGAAVMASLVGYVLGVGLASGLALPLSPVVVAIIAALFVVIAVLGSWIAGLERLVFSRRYARWKVAVGIGIVVLLKVIALGALSTLVTPQVFFNNTAIVLISILASILILMEAIQLVFLAPRVDVIKVMEENAFYAATQSFGVFSPLDPHTIADYRRRCKLAQRGPRFRMPRGEGWAALVSRATLTLLRQYEGWPALLVQGLTLVPFGVMALLEGRHMVLLLFWLVAVLQFSQGAREVTRAFRDDMRNRLVRDRLPFSVFELLVYDSLPAFVLTTVLACVAAPFVAPSAPLWASIALSVLLSAATTLSCGLNAIRLFPNGPSPFYEGGVLVLAVTVGVLSLTGIPELVVGAAAVVCAILVLVVRGGVECVR